MSSLALTSFQIASLPTGEVQIGALTLPGHAARDLAVRIMEAAGDVPAEVAGRIRCREHLDRLFAHIQLINVRDMASGAVGRFPAYRDGRRLCVRLGDSVTATLLNEGERWRGFAVQHRDDPLFGVVGEVAMPMARYSADGERARQLRGKG